MDSAFIYRYCCDNSEEINVTCVECRTGYISNFGETCRICPYGYYGKQCVGICRCKYSESCHQIEGCIEAESTVFATTESIFDINNGSTITTENEDTLLGLSKRELVVYTSSTGLLSIVIIACLMCIRRYKQQTKYYSLRLGQAIRINNTQAVNMHVVERGGVYETIDESNILDEPLRTSLVLPSTYTELHRNIAQTDDEATSGTYTDLQRNIAQTDDEATSGIYTELKRNITQTDVEETTLKTICGNEVQSDIMDDTAPKLLI